MKKNKNMLLPVGTVSKYKALAIARQFVLSLRSIAFIDINQGSSNSHEKLQIIYANIRV